MSVGSWEESDLEESSANARKDAIDVIVACQEGDRSRNVSTALSPRGKSLDIKYDVNCSDTRWC